MNYRHFFPFIVEDDDNFALLLRRAFLKAGVPDGNVHRYPDGESALAHLRSTNVIRPSALLLDMGLPGMTGLSVLKEVRACERLAHLPVFILSGQDDGRLVAAAQALGARGYWKKPLSNGTLQEFVDGIVGSLNGNGPRTLPGNLFGARC